MDFISNLTITNAHIFQIFIALFLGLIIGLKKEITNQETHTKNLIGLRTTPLIVLFGTISTFFNETILSLSFISVIMLVGLAYFNGAYKLNRTGLTTELTIIIVFLIGILVGKNEILLALVLTVVIAILNAYKKYFHNFAKNTTSVEWSGALQLIITSALILPFLPNDAIDPFGIFVPFKIWILVIFISSISFVGYFLTKYFSKGKSLLITSFFGSLVSSTAVTISIAKDSKIIKDNDKIKNKENNNFLSYLTALTLANVIMQTRVLLEILVIGGISKDSSLLSLTPTKIDFIFIFLPGLVMIIYLLITTVFLWQKDNKNILKQKNSLQYQTNTQENLILENTDEVSKSPFELIPAIKFTIFFSVMLFVVYFSGEFFGNIGIYFSSFIASLADVESSVLTSLELLKNGKIDFHTLSGVVTISLITNTLIKFVYIYFFGNKKLAKKFLITILPSIFLGLLTFYIINFMI